MTQVLWHIHSLIWQYNVRTAKHQQRQQHPPTSLFSIFQYIHFYTQLNLSDYVIQMRFCQIPWQTHCIWSTHTRYSLLSLSFSRYSCSRRMHAVCDRHLVVDRLHSVKLKNKSETVGFWYRFELIIILSFFSTKRQPKKCGWQQRECNARAKKVKEEWRTAPDDSLDLKKQRNKKTTCICCAFLSVVCLIEIFSIRIAKRKTASTHQTHFECWTNK